MTCRLAALLFSSVAMLSACQEGHGPCVPMSPPGELANRAAQLRLDVYAGEAQCAGSALAPGAPPPVASKAVAAGQPITLDVPPGRSVLVLTALDGAGALLGSACTEAELGAGSALCFNLTLAGVPDAAQAPLVCDGGPCACTMVPDSCPAGYYCATDGNCSAGCKGSADCAGTPGSALCDLAQHRCVQCLAPADCAPGKRCSPGGACVDGCDVAAGSNCPGAIACCSNLCVDTTSELSSCGACGRACNSTHVATASCGGGVCGSSCLSGYGNCNKPIAPAADDGCETNFNDVMHCGGCTTVCNLSNAVASCPSGTCKVQSCNANRFNCDGQDASGCECAGVDRADGLKGCCPAGTCQAAHTNGLGQSFYNCVAFGAYNDTLAADAARAWSSVGTSFPDSGACGATKARCLRKGGPGTECACWAYEGSNVGYVRQDLTSCLCPTTGDLAYK